MLLAVLVGARVTATGQSVTPSKITAWFVRLDRNGDGKLGAKELPDRAFFRRADADGDGFVTLEEASDLMRARSGQKVGEPARQRPAGDRPNIVFILADDLGYADVGFHGCPDVPTPHIDRIAREGVRFPQAYVTGSVCSPSRAGLLTGRYQQRFGHEFNVGGVRGEPEKVGLPTEERTIADSLRTAGYVCGVIGKWHLGSTPAYHPISRGFDRFFGFLGGARPYWAVDRPGVTPILRGVAAVPDHEYLTDAFGREAEAFVTRHADRPFFLYLAFNAVHNPMQAKREDRRLFGEIEDRKRRTYAGMLTAMDRAVGRVRAAVRACGLEKSTLFVFLGDNGGPTRVNASRNEPLRGGKGTLYEGGVRVPFALAWKGRLEAGGVFEAPVSSLDLLPTFAAVAGARLPKGRVLDGVDLLPFLKGKRKGRPHPTLHWREGARFAVRHGDWKLTLPARRSRAVALFNLKRDPGEREDCAEAEPKIVEKLRALHAAWTKQMIEPRWPAPQRR